MMGYVGLPTPIDELLYEMEISFIKQNIDARIFNSMLAMNLAGMGMMAWDANSRNPEQPFTYRNTNIATFDRNLRSMASKTQANALLAHVRGVFQNNAADAQINEQNIHPFKFDNVRLAMAHLGELHSFRDLRFDLIKYVKPEFAKLIQGSTDSEWIYAIIVSFLEQPYESIDSDDLLQALSKTFQAIREVMLQHKVKRRSSVNLTLCDGNLLTGVRFAFDFAPFKITESERSLTFASQWYNSTDDGVLVSSEPLTLDRSGWMEIPEHSVLMVDRYNSQNRLRTFSLKHLTVPVVSY